MTVGKPWERGSDSLGVVKAWETGSVQAAKPYEMAQRKICETTEDRIGGGV